MPNKASLRGQQDAIKDEIKSGSRVGTRLGMNPAEFWKNFRLGEELSIAGAFTYSGLRRFYELRQLDQPDETFEVLYNLAVGLERLLKIAVVLLEHGEDVDQKALGATDIQVLA